MRGDGSPSERFWCDLIVKGGENDELIGMTNNDLFATFETDAQVKNVNDTVQGFYEKYPDSFPAEIKPSNDGDYVYVDWYSYAHIEGNQYFDISVASNLTGYAGGIVLGMKDDGGTVYQGNGSANLASNLASGVYRTGQGYYVHTYAAYPKSGLKNDVTSTFNHEAVYNLDTADTRRASSARASATKSYTPKEWERPVGFFGISKYGYNTYPLALNDLLKGQDQIAEFNLRTMGFGAPFTADKYYETTEQIPASELGKVSYKLITDDYNTWFDNETAALDSADFEFSGMRVGKPTIYDYGLFDADGPGWSVNSEGNLKEGEVSAGTYGYKATSDPSNQPEIIIEGAVSGSGEYIKYGTIRWNANGRTSTQAFNGAYWDGATIMFPPNVTDTRQTAETKGHGLVYMVYPQVKIKPTDKNIAKAQSLFDNSDSPSTYVRNEAKVHAMVRSYPSQGSASPGAWTATEDVIMGGDDTFSGVASGVSLDVDTKVREPLSSGNPSAARYLFNYIVQLNNQTNAVTSPAYKEAVEKGYLTEETGGKFFCLLPPGVHFSKLSRIVCRTGDTVQDFEVHENWRGSGRDMLVVYMSLSPQARYYKATDYLIGKSGYSDRPYISFLSEMSVEDVEEFGCDTRLVTAYQSSTNERMGTVKGFISEPDDPLFGNHYASRTAVGGYAAEMTGLSQQQGSFAPGTVYAQDRTPISVNMSGVAGLQKEVSIDGGKTWSRGQGNDELNIYGGETYTYRLREGALTDENHIIIYDQLESARATGVDSLDATWRGSLEEVDVSRMVSAGVLPVVYYSKARELDLNENSAHRNLSDTGIWSTEKPADMSEVTAVAIDATKSRNGGDFVLKSGRSLTAYLKMRAPLIDKLVADARAAGEDVTGYSFYDSTVELSADAEKGYLGGAHALNGVVRTSTIVGGENQKVYAGYTKVGLKPFKIEIDKTWDDNSNHDGYRPDSVDVDIIANGWDTVRSVTLSGDATSQTWNRAIIDDLPYKDAAGNKVEYSFAERMGEAQSKYASSIYDRESGDTLSVSLSNVHTLDPVSARIEKIWDDAGDYDKLRPDSVTVKICRDYEDGSGRMTVKTVTLSADNGWVADVSDLPQLYQGRPISYSIWEEKVGGYSYSYTIDGADSASVTVGPDKRHFDVAITNKHVPETRTFTFTKKWDDGDNHDKLRPNEVFIDVYANGVKVEDATVRMSSEDGWVRKETKPLLRFDGSGNEISYSFVERGDRIVPDTADVYDKSRGYVSIIDISGYAGGTIGITNRHPILMASFPLVKHWEDNGNEAGKRPDSIAIDIYANGKFLRQEILTGSADAEIWETGITLDELDSEGNPVSYTFKEHSPVPGYYVEERDPEVPEFVNTYYPYGSLTISKEISSATEISSRTAFEFRIEISHADGTPDGGTYSWTRSDGESGIVENGGTIPILGGQSARLDMLPSECSYKVEELPSAGWRNTGSKSLTGVIAPRSNNAASFSNSYSASGYALLNARKSVEGCALYGDYFRFDLFRVSDDGSETLVSSARNASDGSISFAAEHYTLGDVGRTYRYKIREADTSRAGYEYDARAYDAYVEVSDNGDGTLWCTTHYELDGRPVDIPSFVNVYRATGSVEPVAHKILNGQDLVESAFEFELVDRATGKRISTARNDASGRIVFEPLSFDESDAGSTRIYEIREIPGNDPTVIYSEETYLYQVTARDNHNGTLSLDTRTYKVKTQANEEGVNADGNPPADESVIVDGTECVETAPVFTNESVPGSLRLEKRVDGIAGVDYDPSAEFTFHVTLNAPGHYEFEREEKTEAWSVYTSDDKTMRFVRASSEDKAKARVAEVRGSELPSGADDVKAWTGFENLVAEINEWGVANVDEITPPWEQYIDGTYNHPVDLSSIEHVDIVDKITPMSACRWFASMGIRDISNFENLDFSKCEAIYEFASNCGLLVDIDTTHMDISNVKVLFRVFYESNIRNFDFSSWDVRNVEHANEIVGGYSYTESITVGDNWIFEKCDFGFESYVFGSQKTLFQSSKTGDTFIYDTQNMPFIQGVPDTYTNVSNKPTYGIYTDEHNLYITYMDSPPAIGDTYHDEQITQIFTGMSGNFGGSQGRRWESPFKSIANECEKVIIENEIYPQHTGAYFMDFVNLKEFTNGSYIKTEMMMEYSYGIAYMFKGCTSLTDISLNFEAPTKKLSFESTFEGCISLENIDWNETDVQCTDWTQTFKDCSKIVNPGLEHFSNADDNMSMSRTFLNCSSLREIDLTTLGRSIRHGGFMFSGCTSLEKLDMSNMLTGPSYINSSNCGGFLQYCDNLREVTVGRHISTPVGNWGYPSYSDIYLPAGTWIAQSDGQEYTERNIPSNKADTYVRKMPQLYGIVTAPSETEKHYSLFFDDLIDPPAVGSNYENEVVKAVYTKEQIEQQTESKPAWYSYNVYIYNINIRAKMSPISTRYWFDRCRASNISNLEYIDMSNCKNAAVMFSGNTGYNLKNISGYQNWDMSNVENVNSIFSMTGIEEIDISNWNLNSATMATSMFSHSPNLRRVNLSNVQMNNVKNINSMFYNDVSLSEVNFDGFSATSVINVTNMFMECESLVNLDMSAVAAFSQNVDMSSMFYNCTSLEYLDLSCFSSLYVPSTKLSPIFYVSNGKKYHIKEITLRDYCSINSSYADLPSENMEDFGGKWRNTSTGREYYPYQIREQSTRENIGGTWTSAPATGTSMFYLDFLNPPSAHTEEIGNAANGRGDVKVSAKGIPVGSPFAAEQQRKIVMEQGSRANDGRGILMGINSSSMMSDQEVLFATGDIASGTDKSGTVSWRITSDGTMYLYPTNGTSGNFTLDAYNLTSYPWNDYKSQVKRLFTQKTIFLSSASYMFNFPNCEEVQLSGIDTSNMKYFSSVFWGMSNLTELDIHHFNTQNMTSWYNTFVGCKKLKTIIMPETESVLTQFYIVFGSTSVEYLDLRKINLTGTSSRLDATLSIPNLQKFSISDKWRWHCYYSSDFRNTLSNPPANKTYGTWSSKDANYGSGAGPYTSEQLIRNQMANPAAMAGTWEWDWRPAIQLNFDLNGGTGSVSSATCYAGAQYSLPNSGIYKFGKKLKSWNTEPDGSGTSYAIDSPVVISDNQENIMLYAQWEDEDTTIDATSGSFDVILHPNEDVTIPDIPAGTTYTVSEKTPAGWSIVSEGTTGLNGTIVTNSTSVAAVKNEYTANKTVANIQVTKKLDGEIPSYDASLATLSDTDGFFSFELFPSDAAGNVTGDAIGGIKHNDLSGAVVFESIEYNSVSNKVNGDDYYYVIKEHRNMPDKYDYADDIIVKINVTDNGEGHLTNTVTYNGSEEIPIMSNTSKPGALRIAKLYGEDGIDAAVYSSTRFNFTVKLVHPDGTIETRNAVIGCGEEQVIENLPAGTIYTVFEGNLPAGWSNVAATGEKGEIQAGVESKAEFKNIYRARPVSTMLSASKSMVDGSTMPEGKFSFELYSLSSDAVSIPASALPIQVAKSTSDGQVSFEMLHFESPGTYRYAIRESLAEADSAIEYDTHVEIVDVEVSDNREGALVAQVRYDEDGAAFVNGYKSATLNIGKHARNVSPTFSDRKYSFTVLLRGSFGVLLDGEYSYTVREVVDREDTEVSRGALRSGDEIFLKDGQYASVEIPVGVTYEIRENVPDGFVCESENASGTVSTDDAGKNIFATFTNIYFASGTVSLSASKSAEGFNLEPSQFSFELRTSDGELIASTKNTAAGAVSFPSQAFTLDDNGKIFVYDIFEVDDGQAGIVYDDSVYHAIVRVSDAGDGTMNTEVVYARGDIPYLTDDNAQIDFGALDTVEPSEIAFTNTRALQMPISGEQGAVAFFIAGAVLIAIGIASLRKSTVRESGKPARLKR